jgi:hypothetical protein
MDIQPFILAWHDKQWVLFGALIVGGLITLTKQGYLSTWLAQNIPPRYQPSLAIFLGIGTLMVADIQGGKTWQQAVIDGLFAGLTAIAGHETVIQQLRAGKELIPQTKRLQKAKADRVANSTSTSNSSADSVATTTPAPPPTVKE